MIPNHEVTITRICVALGLNKKYPKAAAVIKHKRNESQAVRGKEVFNVSANVFIYVAALD